MIIIIIIIIIWVIINWGNSQYHYCLDSYLGDNLTSFKINPSKIMFSGSFIMYTSFLYPCGMRTNYGLHLTFSFTLNFRSSPPEMIAIARVL